MHNVLQKLVSQAEEEGVPLAQVMARELSMDEIDSLEGFLRAEMDDNYAAIADFMKDVEVSGSYDLSMMSEDELDRLKQELTYALSDTPLSVPSEA